MLTKHFLKRTGIAALIVGLALAVSACDSSSNETDEGSEETQEQAQEESGDDSAQEGEGGDQAPSLGQIDSLNDSETLPAGDSPVKGDPEAPVTVVEFTSMQCPYCARAAGTLDQLVEKYDGQVRLVFKHFPLGMQPQAEPASRALEAVRLQDEEAFWEMKSKLFDNIDSYGDRPMEELGAELATDLGLDEEQFREDFNSDKVAETVSSDQSLGRELGVRGTPHFFVNGEVVNGAQPLEEFSKVVDEKLQQVETMQSEEDVAPEDVYVEAINRNLE